MTLARTDPVPRRSQIDRELVGEPITMGERTIQPVARLTGWYGSVGNEVGGGAGALVRLTPVEVIVREGENEEYRVPIVDETEAAVRGMMQGALALAVLCWLATLIIRWASGRKRRNLLAEERGTAID